MFPPIRTGTSFYARDVASALQQRGHEVRVVTLRSAEGATDAFPFDVDRMPTLRRSIPGLFKHLTVSSLFPGNYAHVVGRLRREPADVIFLVNHYLDIAFVAVAAARVTRTPLVCSIHTQLQATSPLRQRLFTTFDRLICGRLIFPSCARLIATDCEINRYLVEVHGARVRDKIAIVPFGVGAATSRVAHDYRLHDQLVGIGAVIEQRNFLTSLRVFRMLLDRFPRLRFKILGHVYYAAAPALARELGIADRVEFTGELTQAQVFEETSRSDVYMGLFSGHYTGLGTAALESMLIGVPAVANVPPGLFGEPPLVDMQDYVRADTNDLPAVTARVARLLESQELRERIGAGGRAYVARNLGWDGIARSLEGLFAELPKVSR